MTRTRPHLVALTGPAGCGKTTVARLLEQHNFARVRFAGPLKDMLRALGLTEAQVDGDEKETPCALLCGRTPRQAMQTLGTEWGRKWIGSDVWVNAAMRQIAELQAQGRDVVVDDLRFVNEARALTGRGAVIVKLHRDGAGTTSTHASEVGLPAPWVTLHVDNNGTPEAALHQVLTFINY